MWNELTINYYFIRISIHSDHADPLRVPSSEIYPLRICFVDIVFPVVERVSPGAAVFHYPQGIIFSVKRTENEKQKYTYLINLVILTLRPLSMVQRLDKLKRMSTLKMTQLNNELFTLNL